jgi:hypothetical protein
MVLLHSAAHAAPLICDAISAMHSLFEYLAERGKFQCMQVVSTQNYSEMQKGRIDYVPPQPDVLKGAISQGCAACADAHSFQVPMQRNHRWVMAPLSSERQHHVNIKAAGRHSI